MTDDDHGRTHAPQQLLSDAEFAWIFEAAPMPYLVLTADLTIVAVNRAYRKATATRRTKLLGKKLFDVCSFSPTCDTPMGIDALKASIARAFSNRVPDAMPVVKVDVPPLQAGTALQHRYWSPVNAPLLDEHGAVRYIIHRFKDVTDFISLRGELPQERLPADFEERLLRIEAEMFQRAQERQEITLHLQEANASLQQLDRAKDDFIANVSHELRTPLALILGAIEDLQQASPPLPQGQLDNIAMARRNAMRLNKTIDMLLDFSRAQAGFARVQFQPTDLSAYTGELASVFRSAIEGAGMRLLVDCPPLPEMVYVDRNMWETVVFNLISNAIKFTLEGEIEVSLRARDDGVELRVRDSGCGIPEQELPHLFRRFHRIERQRARTTGGAGIGLALVQELVRLHGGSMRVDSIPGKGTSFFAKLPFGSSHLPQGQIILGETERAPARSPANVYVDEAMGWLSTAPETPLPPHAGQRRPRILLADDNADMRGYVTRLLGRSYDIESVADGRAALAAVIDQPPDLLIADVIMLGMNGIDLVRTLRADPRTAALPVLMMSAQWSEEARTAGIQAGANDYLVKPFGARELLVRIAALLAQGDLIHHEQQLRSDAERDKERLELVLENIQGGFLMLDRDWHIGLINSQAAATKGESREALRGSDFRLGAETPVIDAVQRVMERRMPITLEHFAEAGGRWWEHRLSPAPEGGVIVFSADISRRKRAELRLREAQAKLRLAAETVKLSYWEWDIASGDATFCDEWKPQLGYDGTELANHIETWKSLLHPDERARVLEQIEQLGTAGPLEVEFHCRLRHKSGDYRWMLTRLRALTDDMGRRSRLIGTHLDITEHQLATEGELHVAMHDALTGLPNRKLLFEEAEHVLAGARRLRNKFAVLFIDLDGFKPVNDNHGHDVGDKLLKATAERIARSLRAEDLVSRAGGDEFVVLLVGIDDIPDATHVATNILESVKQPYFIDGLDIEISASMGISLYPKDGETIDVLIQHADVAMYGSKQAGRARFNFYREEDQIIDHSSASSAMATRLREALDADEFSLVFQPVFATATAAVVGAVATIRWRQQDGSQIDPETFLPIAEITGLIKPIGEWLLRTACAQQQVWKTAGLPEISIAVKVSGVQFRQKDFEQRVAMAIRDTGIEPARVLLEMAERTVLSNADESIRVLKGLKGIGVGVTINNFGAADSNVHALSRIPADRLKVDRSYLRHQNGNGTDLAAIDAIIGLGHSLHKEIVAEGVESEEDMAYVREHGCQYAQGYLLARPMPASEFSSWWHRSAAPLDLDAP